jgi:DNA anti-recombination protein RmuC
LHFGTDDGIVVGGRAERVAMEFDAVPTPLQDRLGPEATAGLIALLADARKEWTAEVIGIVGDRFERRLTEETSKLRIEMTQGFAGMRQEMAAGLTAVRQEMAAGLTAVRQEMAAGLAAVRQEMAAGLAAVRQEMAGELAAVRQEMAGGLAAGRLESAEGTAAVRQEMAAGFAALRQEMADQRFELLKWAFIFSVGQFFAVAGLVAVVIRFTRPGN